LDKALGWIFALEQQWSPKEPCEVEPRPFRTGSTKPITWKLQSDAGLQHYLALTIFLPNNIYYYQQYELYLQPIQQRLKAHSTQPMPATRLISQAFFR